MFLQKKKRNYLPPKKKKSSIYSRTKRGRNTKSPPPPPILVAQPPDAFVVHHYEEEVSQVVYPSKSPTPESSARDSHLTTHLTVSQMRRKIRDDADIKQRQRDKINFLVQQLKCAEYDIILVLDEYEKLEANSRISAQAAQAETLDMIAKMKEEHAEELQKKDNIIKMYCEKNKVDRRTVNDVS